MSMNPEVKRKLRDIIKRCQESCDYFLNRYCKVKHPSAGIIPFNTFSYQKKCLAEFEKHRFTIFSKCRQCFAGDSMIWTTKGPRRIDSLKTGDAIYCFDEENGILATSTVQKLHKNGTRDTVLVRTKSGHRSRVTPDHEFLTRRGYIKAEDLTQNDIIIELSDQPRHGVADESDAVLLGYLLSDGHLGEKQVHFTNTSWKYLLEYQKHFELKFGERLRIKNHDLEGNTRTTIAFRICTYSDDAKNWLQKLGLLGLRGPDKKIPEEVFGWNNQAIATLINRLFAGDGWYSGGHCNEAGIGSESVLMLNQIKQLLTRFGIDSKFYPANDNAIAKLRILGGESFNKFVAYIGIYGKAPRNPLTKGFFFNRIKGEVLSVTPDKTAEVYDLTVPPHHNYVVDGAVVHNCGISTLTGARALWYAMFFSNKTILVTSKADREAKEYLGRNIKFVYENLPRWMKETWKLTIDNEHEIGFSNGSRIRSMPSGPHVLRQYSSSWNIIDEASVTPHMTDMWASGSPTLQHGGYCTVIATSNGVGDWYWKTFTDAQEGRNDFNPIVIEWWEMDWKISFYDPVLKQHRKIAPTDGIRKCKTKEEIEKYGPYWSPWLEEQYRQLTEKGDSSKFRQEVLRDFLGSGRTLLSREQIMAVTATVDDDFKAVDRVSYTQPTTNDNHNLEFMDELHVWKNPEEGHIYVAGADTCGGEGRDYAGVEIFDVLERDQVAELQLRIQPTDLAIMIDFLGRWYNNCLVVPERTGIGLALCQALERLSYPNLWRKNMLGVNQKDSHKNNKGNYVGFNTLGSTRPLLNNALLACIGDDGYNIRSRRLLKEYQTFIMKNGKSQAESGSNDDLCIASALALMSIEAAVSSNYTCDLPLLTGNRGNVAVQYARQHNIPVTEKSEREPIRDHRAIMPVVTGAKATKDSNVQKELAAFTASLTTKDRKTEKTTIKKPKPGDILMFGTRR